MGYALIVVSAVAFGAMAIFARAAYADGADVVGVLLGRFLLSGVVLAAVMAATRRAFPRGRALVVAVGMGGVGYVGQAFCYFSALNHASAGLVALLLYAYPTIVCILSAIFLRERLTPTRLALLVASFAGLALTLGGGHGTTLGVALGLSAALIYSAYILVGARELGGTDAMAVTAVVCLSAAATLGGVAAVGGVHWPATTAGWLAIAGLSGVSLVAILSFFAGLKRVGPARASILSTLEPVVTVALAWVFLGESLAAVQLAGGALVLTVAVLLARH